MPSLHGQDGCLARDVCVARFKATPAVGRLAVLQRARLQMVPQLLQCPACLFNPCSRPPLCSLFLLCRGAGRRERQVGRLHQGRGRLCHCLGGYMRLPSCCPHGTAVWICFAAPHRAASLHARSCPDRGLAQPFTRCRCSQCLRGGGFMPALFTRWVFCIPFTCFKLGPVG